MQKQIDEVMGLIDKLIGASDFGWRGGEQGIAIESKLRELLPVWQPIETAPQKVAILVKGGVWMGEIGDPSENCIALVEYDGFRFDECGGDYYSSWIQGPTHWKPVEL